MPNPENGFHFENDEIGWDSLNSDVVQITQVEVDNTVRPMRESLRQRLKLPSNVAPPPPRQEKKSS
jgi:hypothetical protein